MDWCNERYVRVYTRDTLTWKRLRWNGQCVLLQVLRRLDRAGRVALDGMEPWEAVVLLCDAPEDVAHEGMAACLDAGVLVKHDGDLVAPNYIEAQECSASDAERKRRQRDRDKARAEAARSQNVTDGHKTGQKVTNGHAESHAVTDVTPCCATPCHATPNQLNSSPTKVDSAQVREVFDCWRANHLKSPEAAKLNAKRQARIKARLNEGYTVDRLCAAIKGALNDDWIMGRSQKSEKEFRDLETLLRDGSQVERLEALNGKGRNLTNGPVVCDDDWSDVPERPVPEDDGRDHNNMVIAGIPNFRNR